MTLDDILTELIDRGWSLHYLRQSGRYWEASILKPAPCHADTIANYVGYGTAHTPHDALIMAIDTGEQLTALEINQLQLVTHNKPASVEELMKLLVPNKPASAQVKLTRRL